MFDVEGARKAGYSDTEIADHLGGKLGFDLTGAREEGYGDADLVKHLVKLDARSAKDIWSGLPSVVTGAARGVKDVLDTGADLLSRMAGKEENERIKQMNAQGNAEYEARFGDSTAADIGRIGGNILATLPVGGALALPFKAASGAVPALGRVGVALESGGLGTLPATSTKLGAVGNATLRLGAGATVGGASAGMIDPDTAATGAALGAAVPAVIKPLGKLAEKGGQLVRPFTEKGRNVIANDIVRSAATNADEVSQRLSSPPKSIAELTFAEVADDPGVSGLLRHLQNKSPDFAGKYALAKDAQNTERFRFAYGLGGGEEGVAALRQARTDATDPLLAIARANAGDVGTMGVRQAAKQIAESGEMNRSAVRKAVSESVKPFRLDTGDGVKWARKLPFDEAWGARKNIDDMLYGANPRIDSRAAAAAAKQIGNLRERLTTALEKASPDFARYSKTYAEHSTKIDGAKLLNDLVKAASRGQTDRLDYPLLSATQLAQALKRMRPEDAAKLSSEQIGSIRLLVQELERSARSELLGKAVGSNTAQNLDFGLPGLTESIVRMSGAPAGGGILSSIADRLTAGARDKTYGRLGDLLLNPDLAALAFQPPARATQGRLSLGARAALPLLPGPIAPALSESRR